MTEKRYWFNCTVIAACPNCGKQSVEKLMMASLSENPDLINEKTKLMQFACQLCKKPFPDGVALEIGVFPSGEHDSDSSVN